jgi:hypothetical protein
MIEAYIVRDPQGRVIGISVQGFMEATEIASKSGWLPPAALNELPRQFHELKKANVNGYTLTREQVNL